MNIINQCFNFLSKKKIGLALGSGGAKGIAHIGVLEVLEENKLIPTEIAGCSIGAVIGVLYAACVPVHKIKELALSINFLRIFKLFDFTQPKGGGFVSGHFIENFLNENLPVKKFNQLKIPFKCVATDIKTGDAVIYNKGDLIPAIRASISIPGFFIPYRYQEKILVDGSLVDPVPFDLLTKSKYKIAVIVDEYKRIKEFSYKKMVFEKKIKDILHEKVYPHLAKLRSKIQQKSSAIDILSKSMDILTKNIINFNLSPHDVTLLIKPDLNKVPTLAFNLGKTSYDAGVKAARQALQKIDIPQVFK